MDSGKPADYDPATTVRTDTVEIDAPASVVWAVLTDLPRYGEWNPFCVSADSTLEIGGADEDATQQLYLARSAVIRTSNMSAPSCPSGCFPGSFRTPRPCRIRRAATR